jgi:hypothetical protein
VVGRVGRIGKGCVWDGIVNACVGCAQSRFTVRVMVRLLGAHDQQIALKCTVWIRMVLIQPSFVLLIEAYLLQSEL